MTAASEKVMVCIPTTAGPSLVTGLKIDETLISNGAPYSIIILSEEIGNPSAHAVISKRYRLFANGPIAVVDKIVPATGYQFEISYDITDRDSESWKLGVAVAHLLFQEGRLFQLTDNPALFGKLAPSKATLNDTGVLPAKVLWLTGRVLKDTLDVGEIAGEEDKIKFSKPLFEELGDKVALYFPSESKSVLEKLGADFLKSHHVEGDKISYVASLFEIAQAEGLPLFIKGSRQDANFDHDANNSRKNRSNSNQEKDGMPKNKRAFFIIIKMFNLVFGPSHAEATNKINTSKNTNSGNTTSTNTTYDPIKGSAPKKLPDLKVLSWLGLTFPVIFMLLYVNLDLHIPPLDSAIAFIQHAIEYKPNEPSPPSPAPPKRAGTLSPTIHSPPKSAEPQFEKHEILSYRSKYNSCPKSHPMDFNSGEAWPVPKPSWQGACWLRIKATTRWAEGMSGHTGLIVQSMENKAIVHSTSNAGGDLDVVLNIHHDDMEKRLKAGEYRIHLLASPMPLTEVMREAQISLKKSGSLPALDQIKTLTLTQHISD